MAYAWTLMLVGGCLALHALQVWDSRGNGDTWALAVVVLEAYGALSLTAMSVVYAAAERGISFQRKMGRPWWGPRFLFWPFRLLSRLVFRLSRRWDTMEPAHEVAPRLFVGRLPVVAERANLVRLGVDAVLNVCAEFPDDGTRGPGEAWERLFVPILDGLAPSDAQFRACVDWVVARHAEGRTILIHCALGRGRSVTIAAAALYVLGFATNSDEAIARIKRVRPRAKPSRRQRVALTQFCAGEVRSRTEL